MMKSIRIISTLITVIILLSSCSSDDDTIMITVASEKRIGMGATLVNALLVKENNKADWSLFYSTINGFNYEEGYEYVLEINAKRLANLPPKDAASIKYNLTRIASKTPKTSENLPPNIFQDYKYIWVGKVQTIKSADGFTGIIPGKKSVDYVKLDVISVYDNNLPFKEKETIHAELVEYPTVRPVRGKEYIFMAKYSHPAQVLGVYMLDTDIQYVEE